MKRSSATLNTPRRIFLAVIVVLVLVLAWELSMPRRTGIDEHYTGGNRSFGGKGGLVLGTNYMKWKGFGGSLDVGVLGNRYPYSNWQFAPCALTNLHEVTARDANVEFFGVGQDGWKVFDIDWEHNGGGLMIRQGQVVLIRHATDTQTVYALKVVKQRDFTGHFHSRKILPAPNKDAPGRQP